MAEHIERVIDRTCVPSWVVATGYRPLETRVPQSGDIFYDPVSDRVLVCEIPESLEFVILSYERPA